MKLKALLLVVCAAAGVGASVALAGSRDGGRQGDRGKACRAAMIAGTVAPQTFTLTVVHAFGHSSPATGSTVSVTIGGSGQTVVASVGTCSGGSSTTPSPLTVRSVDLRAMSTPATTGTTSTNAHHDDGGRRRHHNRTTTTATTTTTS